MFKNYVQLEKSLIAQYGGSYQVKYQEQDLEMVFDFLIERKTVFDLCASIRDGRMENQILRMEQSDFSRIVYLIEGTFQPNKCEL
jgi:ERCC4-type nuclease